MNGNSTRRVVVEPGGTRVVAQVGVHALESFADRFGLGDSLSDHALILEHHSRPCKFRSEPPDAIQVGSPKGSDGDDPLSRPGSLPVSERGERDGSRTWDEGMGRIATEAAANAWGAGSSLLLELGDQPP